VLSRIKCTPFSSNTAPKSAADYVHTLIVLLALLIKATAGNTVIDEINFISSKIL
jgi:hypothetical protein